MNINFSDKVLPSELITWVSVQLQSTCEERELTATTHWLLEEIIGLKRSDIIVNTPDHYSQVQLELLKEAINRLQNKEPIQHILTYAYFYGRKFTVSPDVLIPRPETEELVFHILQKTSGDQSVLDIGTGSGCIPITLKLENPSLHLTAIDISQKALTLAHQNASILKADVSFFQSDILSKPTLPQSFDVIVSNPPYVRNSEKAQMQKNVLDFEPARALFVSDVDPLIFYREISHLALKYLNKNGLLFFEINEAFGDHMVEMLTDFGYKEVAIHKDMQNKDRIAIARKSTITYQ